MSAFMDSGHWWWQQCQLCHMAWRVDTKPNDVDDDVTCAKCDAEDNRVTVTRAEGFAAAREKAARIADGQPGGYAATAARLIRAMQDDSVREWHGCADPRGHQFSDGECRNDGCGMKIKP